MCCYQFLLCIPCNSKTRRCRREYNALYGQAVACNCAGVTGPNTCPQSGRWKSLVSIGHLSSRFILIFHILERLYSVPTIFGPHQKMTGLRKRVSIVANETPKTKQARSADTSICVGSTFVPSHSG